MEAVRLSPAADRLVTDLDGARPSSRARSGVAVIAAVCGIVLFAAALRFVSFQGYWGTDDGEYAVLANAMSKGQFWSYVDENYVRQFNGPAHIPFRVGLIAPLALGFRMFGVHETTLVAYPLLISVLGAVLAFLCARRYFGDAGGLIAAALWAMVPVDIDNATLYLPDGIASFYASAGVLIVLMASEADRPSRQRSFTLGLAAGLLFGISWLTKETVTYLVPLCGLLILAGMRRDWRAVLPIWTGVAVASGAILLSEMTYYAVARGDFMLRMHENERSFQQTKSYLFYEGSRFGWPVGGSHAKALLKRLFQSGPETIFVNSASLCLPLFGALAIVRGWVVKDRSFQTVGLWLLTLAAMFNFASPTFKSYTPLVLLNRYLMPLVLPAAVLAAGLLVRLLRPEPARAASENRERRFWGLATAIALLAMCVVANFQQIRDLRRVRPMYAERHAAALIGPQDRVYTDPMSRKALSFYWRYPATSGLLDFEGMKPEDIAPGSYVLVDKNRLNWLNVNVSMWLTKDYGYHRPEFADRAPASWKVLWRDVYITLYKVS